MKTPKYVYREWGVYARNGRIPLSQHKTMKEAVNALLERGEGFYVKNEQHGFTILPSQAERLFTKNETIVLDKVGEVEYTSLNTSTQPTTGLRSEESERNEYGTAPQGSGD